MFSNKHRKPVDASPPPNSSGMGKKTRMHFDRVKDQMREFVNRGPPPMQEKRIEVNDKLDRSRTPSMPHKAFTPLLKPKHHDSSMAFRTPQSTRHLKHRHLH